MDCISLAMQTIEQCISVFVYESKNPDIGIKECIILWNISPCKSKEVGSSLLKQTLETVDESSLDAQQEVEVKEEPTRNKRIRVQKSFGTIDKYKVRLVIKDYRKNKVLTTFILFLLCLE